MANIILMGCSWAMGEWEYSPRGGSKGTSHPGIAGYLAQYGHTVTNLATPAGSNKEQVDLLLEQTMPDHVIWLLTDPMRDKGSCPPMVQTLQNYLDQRDNLLRLQLDRTRHLPVLLLGGVSRVPQWCQVEFPHTRVLCDCLHQWLLPKSDPHGPSFAPAVSEFESPPEEDLLK